MDAGINKEQLKKINVEMLEYIEQLKSVDNRLDNIKTSLKNNINGSGSNAIISKLSQIIEQLPIVTSNINIYITDINKVINMYESMDSELSTTIINDIEKLEG